MNSGCYVRDSQRTRLVKVSMAAQQGLLVLFRNATHDVGRVVRSTAHCLRPLLVDCLLTSRLLGAREAWPGRATGWLSWSSGCQRGSTRSPRYTGAESSDYTGTLGCTRFRTDGKNGGSAAMYLTTRRLQGGAYLLFSGIAGDAG